MQVYSFINSGDAFHWERNPASFMKSRIFEYTDDHVIEFFRGTTGFFKDSLIEYPVLFSVEQPHDVAARVGWIESISWEFGDPVISFRFDDSFRPIQQAELEEIKWELGIADFEFHRTHWAVKQADLLRILRNRGFSIPVAEEPVVTLPPFSKTVPAAAPAKTPSAVFVSYSHADAEHLKRLQVHLSPLKKWTELNIWDDTRISVGDNWREEIENALATCSAAVLLVSADFLASDFISDNELPPLLKKAEVNGTRIIPLILKPCLYTSHPELRKFQALNAPDQSLISLDEAGREALWSRLAKTVYDMIDR